MPTKLGSAYGEVIVSTRDSVRSIADLGHSVGGLEKSFFGINPLIAGTTVALGGLVAVGGGLTAAIGSSVSVAADLEAQLSDVQAASGATNAEMVQLKELVSDLGLDPKLKVSASEAANAIEVLTKNGLTVQEVLDGAARSTVLLTNATGAEFTQAADIATSAMSIFNIEAKDMEAAVDSITGVVNASKFGIEDYALALSQGGGAAATFGVSLSDFNTVIAGTSSLFSSGGDSGTSFKAMLQKIANPTDEARGAMKALNLEFYDADGNLKGMNEIAVMLNKSLFKEFQQTVELGGATKEMAKAAETATKKIPKLTTTLSEQDQQMAILQKELQVTIEKYGEGSTQADNKRLAITRLTNAITENKQELATQEAALGAMADATVETITTTTKLTEEQRAQSLSVIFGSDAIRQAAGVAALGVESYTTAADAAAALGVSIEEAGKYAEGGITAFEALQLQMGKVSAAENAATRMDNLKSKIEIVQGVIESLQIEIGDRFIPILSNLADSAASFLSNNADSIVGFFERIATNAEVGIEAITRFVDGFKLGFGEGGIEGVIQGIELGLMNVLSPFGDVNPEQMAFITTITDGLRQMAALLPELDFTKLQESLSSISLTDIATGIQAVGGALAGAGIAAAILGIVAAVASLVNPITAIIGIAALLGAAWATNWGGIRDIVTNAMTTMEPYFTKLQALLDNFAASLLPALQAAWNQLGIAWTTQIAPALGQLWTAFNDLLAALGITSEKTTAFDALMGLLKLTLGLVLIGAQGLTGAIIIWTNTVMGAIEGATTFINWLVKIKEAADGVADGIGKLVGKIADFAAEIAGLEIPDWFKPGSPTPLEMGIRGISDALNKMPDLQKTFETPAQVPVDGVMGGVSDIQATMANLAVPTLPDLPLAAALPTAGETGGTSNVIEGDVIIQIDGTQNPTEVAKEVEKVLQNIFGRVRRPAFAGV